MPWDKPSLPKARKTLRSDSLTGKTFLTGYSTCGILQLIRPGFLPSGDGVIHITGDPFGYMRTKDVYSDYKLHVEWRYPGELSNSGVFVHSQTPDTIWLKCFECQLHAGDAGDFICMNGSSMNEQKEGSRVIKKMNPSNEKPAGEWNTMEVICKSNTIEVSVNGLLQNKATGISDSKGHICLQSEGKDIQFRNVYLIPLPQEKSKSKK